MTGILDLDALLDQSMDAVKAAPNFVQPETSTVILGVEEFSVSKQKSSEAAIKDGKAPEYVQIKAVYRIETVLEQEKGTPPMGVGSLFSETWLAQDKGLEFFKARANAIAGSQGVDVEAFGKLSLRQMVEALNDTSITFKTNVKKVPRPNTDYFNTRLENITSASA